MKPLSFISVLFIFLLVMALLLGCETTPKQVQSVMGECVDNLNKNHKSLNTRNAKLYESQAKADAEMIAALLKQQGDDPNEVDEALKAKLAIIEANLAEIKTELDKVEKDYKLYKDLERALQ